MQFKVQLNNNGIGGRYTLKFRDNNEDPTFMRQDLYGDILNAVGYPTIQSVKTRVYVNGRGVGYYILQEEAPSESFVRTAFHGKNGKFNNAKVGQVFDCSTGADFYYKGNTFTSFQPKGSYDQTRIKKLAQAFNNLNVNNSNAVKTFEKQWFDIDIFFRGIALEYLTAHWDSYWFYSSNFAMYNDPTESTSSTYKFYFICQDWDGTFGLNASKDYLHYSDYIKHSYKDYVNVKWHADEYDSPQRFAVDKLLSNATLRARFETILKNIVVKIFNPTVIGKRLDALVERHREEVAWNYDMVNNHPLRKGTNHNIKWTIKDFDTNIETAAGHGASYGIKQFISLRVAALNKEFGLNINLGKAYKEDSGVSTDGLCGKNNGKCPSGQCCSKYGYCGTGNEYCGTGCQSEFGKCNSTKTTTKKTTTKTTTKKTTTKKTTTKKTTTKKNTTKTTTKKSTTKAKAKQTTDNTGRCGSGFGKCPSGQCCSQYGYCGTTSEYCKTGCQKSFGTCK